MSIQATTPLKFYVAAQLSKNGAGNFNISYQTSGDTPPAGFNIGITNAGLVQVTLPSLGGFGSASINYALNAPAVGVTLPISIQSTQVVGDTNPIGTLLDFAGSTAPTGYMMCDGRSLSTSGENAGLFAVIGYSYGGSGANFNIPDFRGRFARYNDDMGTGAAGRDIASRNADKSQGQATARPTTGYTGTISGTAALAGSHSHSFTAYDDERFPSTTAVGGATGNAQTITTSTEPSHTHSVSGTCAITGGGDAETRPINVSCNKIIKFRY